MAFVKVGAAYNKAEGPKPVLKRGGKWRNCEDKEAEELLVVGAALESEEEEVVVVLSLSVMTVSSRSVWARAAAALVRLVNSVEGLVSGLFVGMEGTCCTC